MSDAALPARPPESPGNRGNPAPLGAEGFRREADVSHETLERLERYAALLIKWQAGLNLVGRSTLGDLWRRHMLDSAQLLPLIPAGARRLVDLGSGAGFPGLVLAALGVEGVELVESNARKCAFLAEAARVMAVPVRIHNARIEALPALPADVVTARACAPLPALIRYAERFVGEHTVCLFLKGARVEAELTAAMKEWRMTATSLPSRTRFRSVVLHIQGLTRERR